MSNIKYIIVHHSGGTDANPMQDSSNYTLAMCNADHKIRFNMKSSLGYYVGYTFFMDKFGVITQTRKIGEEGAHTIGHNNDSIGIHLSGNFDATLPTDLQVKSLTEFLKKYSAEYSIANENIIPHRHFANKTCYGNKLSDDWARNLIKTNTSVLLKPAKMGDSGENVKNIQDALIKKNAYFIPQTFKSGIYDEAVAKAVLYFQLENKVADNKELSSLRGETVGPKTLAKLSV